MKILNNLCFKGEDFWSIYNGAANCSSTINESSREVVLFYSGLAIFWCTNTTTPKEGFDKFFQLWVVKRLLKAPRRKKLYVHVTAILDTVNKACIR